MANTKKDQRPLFSVGDYQLVRRNRPNPRDALPDIYKPLNRLAEAVFFYGFFSLSWQIMILMGIPEKIIYLLIAGLIAIYFVNPWILLDNFSIKNSKNPTQSRQSTEELGLIYWGFVALLAVLGIGRLYISRVMDVPFTAPLSMAADALLFAMIIPYYFYLNKKGYF
ncbi:MAG: hypothetical protein Q4B88_02045 [Moraxella sp.]|nr:hypothetical protein [Moraxella sp.]